MEANLQCESRYIFETSLSRGKIYRQRQLPEPLELIENQKQNDSDHIS